jgi:hypothetical protein
MLESALEKLGRIFIKFIQFFYTVPRKIRVTGQYGSGQFQPFDGYAVRGDWDIRVETAATAPTTKAARDQQAIQLFQLGVVDARALLEQLNWPGYEEVLKRKQDPMAFFYAHSGEYPGFPGQPNRDRIHESGYGVSILNQPPAAPQAPMGQQPGQPGQPGQKPQGQQQPSPQGRGAGKGGGRR